MTTLSDSDTDAIRSFLESPDTTKWERIEHIVVAEDTAPVTLQQAIESVTFIGWERVPDAFSVLRALKAWSVVSIDTLYSSETVISLLSKPPFF